jgi:serpin B
MCYAGAKSETAEQLKQLLNLDEFENDEKLFASVRAYLTKLNTEVNSENVSLNTANKLYPRTGFTLNQPYLDTVKNHFLSEVQQLNYSNAGESANTINQWVANQTRDKIKDLISPQAISSDTELILVNAIYFKGDWLHQFKKENTTKEDFHLDDGSTIKIDMMKLNGKRFPMLENPFGLEARTCQIPYMGNNVSMTIILPNDGVKLSDIERNLSFSRIHNILDHLLKSSEHNIGKVNIQLPRFKLEYKNELSSHFKELGATLPFDRANADFSGINSEARGLHISKVVHQAVVDVNEQGTEAAAATGIIMMTRCLVIEDPPKEFIVNKPFLFILHETIHNAVLFFGKVVNPQN